MRACQNPWPAWHVQHLAESKWLSKEKTARKITKIVLPLWCRVHEAVQHGSFDMFSRKDTDGSLCYSFSQALSVSVSELRSPLDHGQTRAPEPVCTLQAPAPQS